MLIVLVVIAYMGSCHSTVPKKAYIVNVNNEKVKIIKIPRPKTRQTMCLGALY